MCYLKRASKNNAERFYVEKLWLCGTKCFIKATYKHIKTIYL